MKRFTYDPPNVGICGLWNSSPYRIARACILEVLPSEQLHHHSKVPEYYIFLRGEAEMEINGEITVVKSGDVLMIEPGETHRLVRIIEELDYMTIKEDAGDKHTNS
jgi:mannose-6-phosphate isomerase-like protein (cupin superfamily)